MANFAKLDQAVQFLEQIVQDDELCDQLTEAFAANHQLRDRTTEALRLASRRLEDPWHLMHRFSGSATDVTMFQAGSAIGLWECLVAKAPDSVDVGALAESTGAHAGLLVRLLRYAASQGMVDQTDRTSFKANRSTRHLSTEGIKCALFINANVLGPMKMNAHHYLESINYTEPADATNTAWGYAFGTKSGFFDYLASQPKSATAFHGLMKFQQQFLEDWVETVPLRKYLDVTADAPDRDRIVFCDVAGGNGRQAMKVLGKYPDVESKIVLQDRPDMAVECPPELQFVPFDLFEPNPTRGAKIYYLRYILHDWPDERCRVILRHLRDAMAPDSVILINDLVIRDMDPHPHWFPAKQDMAMMMGFAAKERTVSEWDSLFDASGLQRIDTLPYDDRGLAIQVLTIDQRTG